MLKRIYLENYGTSRSADIGAGACTRHIFLLYCIGFTLENQSLLTINLCTLSLCFVFYMAIRKKKINNDNNQSAVKKLKKIGMASFMYSLT